MRFAQAFAYAGHNVCLEIQATLPGSPPTLRPYMRGAVLLSWQYRCAGSQTAPDTTPCGQAQRHADGTVRHPTSNHWPLAGVYIAYGVVSWCYFTVAFTGWAEWRFCRGCFCPWEELS